MDIKLLNSNIKLKNCSIKKNKQFNIDMRSFNLLLIPYQLFLTNLFVYIIKFMALMPITLLSK